MHACNFLNSTTVPDGTRIATQRHFPAVRFAPASIYRETQPRELFSQAIPILGPLPSVPPNRSIDFWSNQRGSQNRGRQSAAANWMREKLRYSPHASTSCALLPGGRETVSQLSTLRVYAPPHVSEAGQWRSEPGSSGPAVIHSVFLARQRLHRSTQRIVARAAGERRSRPVGAGIDPQD